VNTKKHNKTKSRRQKKKSLLPYLIITSGLFLIVFAMVIIGRGKTTPGVGVEVTGRPNLKVDQQLIDFGDVRLGDWVEATFTLTNSGDQPLSFVQTPYIEVLDGC
jgi:hypothetical protein